MKKFFIFLALLTFIAGCAPRSTILRDTYMDRAANFDQLYKGEEFTPKYRWCYSVFFSILFQDCQPQLVDGLDPAYQDDYWTCADTALDKMEECMEVSNERDR